MGDPLRAGEPDPAALRAPEASPQASRLQLLLNGGAQGTGVDGCVTVGFDAGEGEEFVGGEVLPFFGARLSRMATACAALPDCVSATSTATSSESVRTRDSSSIAIRV